MHTPFQDQEARDIQYLLNALEIKTIQNSPGPIYDQVEFYYDGFMQVCESDRLLDTLQKLYSEQKKKKIAEVQGLTFSLALENLKLGKKVARKGWNGKDMWLHAQFPDKHSKMNRPYIYMKAANDELVPWVASQSDLLEDDWEIIND